MMDNHDQRLVSRLARGVGVNMTGKLVGRAMHIGGQVLLARWLGPSLFGLYAIGWNIIRFAATILPLGMDVGVLEQGSGLWPQERQKAGRLALNAMWLTLGASTLAGFLLFIGAERLSGMFTKPDLAEVLRLFALMLPLASGLKVAASGTRISQQMGYGVLSEEIVQPALNVVLISVFFAFGFGLGGAVWASTISFGVGLLVAFGQILKLFAPEDLKSSFDIQLGRQLLALSAPIAAAAIFTTLMLLVDRILVGYFLSEADAGVYQAISIFAVFFVTVLSALKIIAAPMVSAVHHDGEAGQLQQVYQLSTRWGLYLALPVAAVLLAAPEQSIVAVFGAEYSAGSAALVWLTLAQIANMFSGPVEFFLIMTGHSLRWVRITAVMLIANLALNWLLIPRLGILGGAVATLVAFAGTSFWATLSVWRRLGIWPFSRGYLKIAAAVLVTGFSFRLLPPLEVFNPIVVLAGLAALACVTFFGTLWLLGLEREELQLLGRILQKASTAQ